MANCSSLALGSRKAIPKYTLGMREKAGNKGWVIASKLIKVVLILWALSWTLLGAIVGLLGRASGGRMRFHSGVLVASLHRLCFAASVEPDQHTLALTGWFFELHIQPRTLRQCLGCLDPAAGTGDRLGIHSRRLGEGWAKATANYRSAAPRPVACATSRIAPDDHRQSREA